MGERWRLGKTAAIEKGNVWGVSSIYITQLGLSLPIWETELSKISSCPDAEWFCGLLPGVWKEERTLTWELTASPSSVLAPQYLTKLLVGKLRPRCYFLLWVAGPPIPRVMRMNKACFTCLLFGLQDPSHWQPVFVQHQAQSFKYMKE